jgi:putative acetyltransferase
MMLVVKEAAGSGDIATARELFLEYQRGLGVDLCFQSFDEELNTLPGRYARPSGRLLLAVQGESAVGVVAMRGLNGADCEMKRLYVCPEGRGLGVARLLTARLIDEARISGYRRMLLDTLPSMAQAQALYRSLGFSEIEPYCENPISGTLYMALDLLSRGAERRE